jgi:hypothetical protein
MGRLSQLFWVLQEEAMPNMTQSQHHYTHLDIMSDHTRKEIKKLRRIYKKDIKDENNS